MVVGHYEKRLVDIGVTVLEHESRNRELFLIFIIEMLLFIKYPVCCGELTIWPCGVAGGVIS
jgi:hypothetical protein